MSKRALGKRPRVSTSGPFATRAFISVSAVGETNRLPLRRHQLANTALGAETGGEARSGIGSWIDYYNERRPHSTFGGRPPDEVHAMAEMTEKLAA